MATEEKRQKFRHNQRGQRRSARKKRHAPVSPAGLFDVKFQRVLDEVAEFTKQVTAAQIAEKNQREEEKHRLDKEKRALRSTKRASVSGHKASPAGLLGLALIPDGQFEAWKANPQRGLYELQQLAAEAEKNASEAEKRRVSTTLTVREKQPPRQKPTFCRVCLIQMRMQRPMPHSSGKETLVFQCPRCLMVYTMRAT
jgi:hypothetical protein